MSITQQVIVINEGFEERQRTTSAGTKSRYTVSVNAEPILHNFSEEKLGEGPALAIKEAIRDGIKAIGAIASESTRARRDWAKDALERGVRSVVQRYSGGRTGTKPPSGAVRMFNDSGRLADGLEVRQNTAEKNWTINVPANRLDPSTFRTREAFLAMVDQLRALVPALRNPLDVPTVRAAIADGMRNVLIKELKRTGDLRLAQARQVLSLIGF